MQVRFRRKPEAPDIHAELPLSAETGPSLDVATAASFPGPHPPYPTYLSYCRSDWCDRLCFALCPVAAAETIDRGASVHQYERRGGAGVFLGGDRRGHHHQ